MQEQIFAKKPKARSSWQVVLARLVFGLALVVLVYGLVLRPWVSRMVGQRVAQEIRIQVNGQVQGQLSDQISGQVSGQISGQLSDRIAGQVSGSGAGEQLSAAAADPAAQQVAQGGAPADQAPAGAGAIDHASYAATSLAVALYGEAPAQTPQLGRETATALVSNGAAAGGAQPAASAASPELPAGGNEQPAAAGQSGQSGTAGQSGQSGQPGPAGATAAPTSSARPTTPAQPTATALAPTPVPISTALPAAVAALPIGEVVVSEEAVNRRLKARLNGDGPIESAEMHFVPGEMRATLVIIGTTNEIRAGLAVAGGQIVVRNPRLIGPMALIISVDDLVDPIEEQVNVAFEATDRVVRDVRIEQGQIVAVME